MRTKQNKPAGERTQWKKGSYKVMVNPRCGYEVQPERNGYIYDGIFGVESGRWSVTHIPSGFKMPGYFDKLRNAKAFVEAIANLADWQSVTENDTTALLKVKNEVMQAVKTHGI